MKRLIFIGGAMGVGKTATARALQNRLQPAAMLDGDWCWDIRPFTVNDGTKEMVQQNITFLLRQFLHSPACDTVIFSWVMDHREIAEELLRRIGPETLRETEVHWFSLTCSPETLERHIRGDIEKGLRKESDIERSIARLPLYDKLPSVLIPVDGITAEEAADAIIQRMNAE